MSRQRQHFFAVDKKITFYHSGHPHIIIEDMGKEPTEQMQLAM